MLENWEFGIRPEIVEVRYVKIQGKKFPLETFLEILCELEYTDLLHPFVISDPELIEALETEGMIYSNSGGYVGTEKVGEAIERLRGLKESDLAQYANPTLKTGYLCSATFDYELGSTPTMVYPDPQKQRDEEGCVDGEGSTCKLIKVAVHALEVVE